MVKIWEYLTKVDDVGLPLILTLIIALWLKVPQALFSKIKEVLDFQTLKLQLKSTEAEDLKKELDGSKKSILELTREVDIRKEINRQDTLTIVQLKKDLDSCESKMNELRRLILELEGALDEARAKIKDLDS